MTHLRKEMISAGWGKATVWVQQSLVNDVLYDR